MKKTLLIMLCAFLCVSSFAAEGHKCGLKAENISIEGTMINNYSALLKFTLVNPTEVEVRTDHILLYDEVMFNGIKGYVNISYIYTGENPLPVSLKPGETKDVELLLYNMFSSDELYKICISGDFVKDGFIDELGRIEVNMEMDWRPLDITGAIELDNMSGKGKHADFYGYNQTGRVCLTNNEKNPFLAYYGSDQYVHLLLQKNDGNGKYSVVKSASLAERIEAGETLTADFSLEGELEDGKDYILVVEYGTMQYLGMHAAATDTIFFTAHNTPAYWKQDGKAVALSSEDGKTYKVPADAAAVNLERLGAEATVDLSGASPNCLYYLAEDAVEPTGIDGKNIIKGKKAETVNLYDGHGFYCPARFTADNAFYTRKQTVENIDDGGWEPMTLPFDTDGMELFDINGLHTDGNVTVKDFTAINGDVLEFTEVETEGLKADKPYIIKVETPELRIMFHGADKAFCPQVPQAQAGKYKFAGNFCTGDIAKAYVVNSNGTAFELKDNAALVPFRGYIVAENGTTDYARLYIDKVSADGISTVTGTVNSKSNKIYTIGGIRVDGVNSLPKGLYIKSGKKIVKN